MADQGSTRSFVARWLGGASKPASIGQYGAPVSMLAYWLGGGNFHFVPRPPEPPIPPYVPVSEMGGGLPHAKRHYRRLDDEEILEFIRIWTLWNDVE